MLTNELFSNLNIIDYKEKRIYIVDEHNYVFPIWNWYHQSNIDMKLKLVTFDYHTDTHVGLSSYSCCKAYREKRAEKADIEEIRKKRLQEVDFSDMNSVIELANDLRNDEHIRMAREFNIICEYHVINYENDYFEDNVINGYYYIDHMHQGHADCLEDTYFNEIGFNIPDGNIILDFDLDYFNYLNCFSPNNRVIISELIKKSQIITIAREPRFFELLREEEFTVDEAEILLVQLIKDIIDNG